MAAPTSEFNDFLYAAVGDDTNGMELTVLSALARQNVDPWEEAAGLSRLPGETAIGRFVAMLEGLPGFASIADRTRLARRLIPLLPHPLTASAVPVDPVARFFAANRSPHATSFFVILCYLAIMLLAQWVMSGVLEGPHDGGAAPVAAAPSDAPAAR